MNPPTLAERAASFHRPQTPLELVSASHADMEAWTLYAEWHDHAIAPALLTPAEALESIRAYIGARA